MKTILNHVNREIFLVTASNGGKDNGMIITWLIPATLVVEKPRIIVVLSTQNLTTQYIQASRKFVVHLLAEEQCELVSKFGLYSGRTVNKFDGMKLERTKTGLPVVKGSCGWIECKVSTELDLGDRVAMVCEIVDAKIENQKRKPLLKSDAFANLPDEDVKGLIKKREEDAKRDLKLMRFF